MSKIVPVPTVTMSNYNNSRTPSKNVVPAIATVNDLLTTCDSNVEQQQALLPLHLLNEQILVQNKRNAAKLRWWHAPPPKPLTITEPQMSATMPILQQELAAEQDCKTTACQQQQQQLEKQQTKLPHNTLQANTASPQYKNNNEAKRITYAEQQHHQQQQQQQQQQKSFDDFNDIPEDCCSSQSSELLAKDPKPCVGLLNPEEEDQMQVTGYRRSAGRMFLCWFCICLTGGILRLVMHWWRHWYLMATHVPCPLDEAEKVLIQDDYQGKHKTFYVKTVQLLSVCDIREQLKGKQKSKTKHEDLNAIIMPMQNDDWNEKNMHLSVHFSSAHFKQIESVRVFNCKQLRYAWDQQSQSFIKINGLDVDVLSTYLHSQRGLSAHEQLARRLVYGSNEISIPYRDVKTLLFLEVLNPFYVFQIFSVILWFTYDYYYYACVILLMSIFGISMSIVQTKKNQDALRETVQNTGCALVITEKGEVKEVPTQSLVPGDIIEIPSSGCIMQCDAVLLTGNCILDEAMLTGESVPVTKTPLPVKHDMIFDKKEHARHTLFCGTKVIQTRYIGSEKVLAIVINTGNITAKGGLIRSILYPPPVDYKFEQDSYKFIAVLGLIALIGFTYTLVSKILRHVNAVKIIVESLDLITIVVPPALPAAMTVGRFYAQKRLERNNIYCISPRSINVAGSIDCCCFDKTGTLTEDGLDMWGVVPKSAVNEFQIPIKQIERLSCDNFLFGMVTCHSITVMNGKMMGDPLDLKMFESTGWILEDPKEIPDNQKYGLIHPTIVRQPKQDKLPNISGSLASVDDESSDTVAVQRQSSVNDLLADVGLLHGEANNDHGIVREFPFTSAMQRMSVITRRLSDNHFCVYCKGSPEMLQQLCKPSSTPPNYSQQLATFAKQGYRVIAMAYKPLSQKMNYTKAQRLTRESVESELEFLGFVVLENRLKPDTTEVIQSLTAANIRTIMVTGDNVLTALSVARDCGIVQESQAVVTVNVRSTPNKHKLHELYYTLEMGNKDCAFEPAAVNGNGSLAKGEVAIDVVGVYGALNGDVSLSNSASMLQNSSSLTSVETCDTWTHADVETGVAMALPSMKTNLDKASAVEMGWQHNYRFAMVGETWQIVREHFPDELRNFVTRGSIFARMSPEQKQSLIMELQSMDYCVAMCGDGANDCGALKVAHTGISLSETESSIASPFTSRNPTIACVPKVIKEGRAALVTSFGIFKYMAAYSMVQFISVMILYSIDSNLTDKQYLYIDLGLISVFAFFFGKTESYDGVLVKQVPLSSLISLTPLASIILHLLIVIVFQVSGWFHVHAQDWFTPFVLSEDDHFGCFENYTMFAISGFQYIILAFVFSKGVPYRKPIWSNIPFCLALLINLIILIYMVLIPPVWLTDFFQLIVPPVMEFRYWMLGYGIFSFVVHVFVEAVIVEYLLFKKIQVRRMLLGNKRQHMQVEYDLKMCSNWPPITHAAAYEASELEATPIYVEMRAGQKVQMPVPQNTSLFGFFEVETPTTPSAEESLSPKHDFPPASGTQALFRQPGATNIHLE